VSDVFDTLPPFKSLTSPKAKYDIGYRRGRKEVIEHDITDEELMELGILSLGPEVRRLLGESHEQRTWYMMGLLQGVADTRIERAKALRLIQWT